MDWLVVLTTCFVLLVTVHFLLEDDALIQRRRKNREPPGPGKGLPLLGHMHYFLGDQPHNVFRRLAMKYGPVLSIRMGAFPVVVIHGGKLIRKAFSLSSLSDRPHMKLLHEISMGGKGIVSADSVTAKSRREFFQKSLQIGTFSPFGSSHKSKVGKQAERFIRFIDKYHVGKPFQVYHAFHPYVMSIMMDLIFEDSCNIADRDVERFAEGVSRANDLGPFDVLGMFIPKLSQYFPQLTGYAERIRVANELRLFVGNLWQGTRKNETGCKTLNTNLASGFWNHLKNKLGKVDNESAVMCLVDLFVGGFAETCEQLEWVTYYLATEKHARESLEVEVDKFVAFDSEGKTTISREHMKFTEAFINETLRMASLGPLGLPHAALEDTEFEGYLIPKGTIILGNFRAAHYNSHAWEKPETFWPDRFLNLDKRGGMELRKSMEDFLPFGRGRRACVGEALARYILFIFVVKIVKHYQLNVVGRVFGGKTFGFSIGPKPFQVIFERRVQQ